VTYSLEAASSYISPWHSTELTNSILSARVSLPFVPRSRRLCFRALSALLTSGLIFCSVGSLVAGLYLSFLIASYICLSECSSP